jgi:hypothetical protein
LNKLKKTPAEPEADYRTSIRILNNRTLARVAVDAAGNFLKELPNDRPLQLVRFVLFSSDVMSAFEAALANFQA